MTKAEMLMLRLHQVRQDLKTIGSSPKLACQRERLKALEADLFDELVAIEEREMGARLRGGLR